MKYSPAAAARIHELRESFFGGGDACRAAAEITAERTVGGRVVVRAKDSRGRQVLISLTHKQQVRLAMDLLEAALPGYRSIRERNAIDTAWNVLHVHDWLDARRAVPESGGTA